MQVKQLAKIAGVTADTVRYYTKAGLLSPSKNRSNGYKEYSQQDCRRLQFILSAKQLGFSLDDISQILAEAGKGKTACPLVRQIIEQRLMETEVRFNEIRLLRKRMQTAVNDWKDKPNKVPTGHMICHLIESMASS